MSEITLPGPKRGIISSDTERHAPARPTSTLKIVYRRLRVFTQVVGTLVTIGGMVVSAVYWIYDYRSACEAKGVGLYICVGGSLRLVDVDAVHDKDLKIRLLQETLARTEAALQRASVEKAAVDTVDKAAQAEVQAALKKASDEIRSKDARITDLNGRIDGLNARLNALLGRRKPNTESGPSSRTRPPAKAYSVNIWPSGTIPYGTTVQQETEYGPIQCTGGNNNIGADRNCVWLK